MKRKMTSLPNQYFGAFLILLLAISLPAQAENKNILVLGDSISAAYGMDIKKGWVTLLEQTLEEQSRSKPEWANYRVINASVSGNTTGDGLGRLPKLLETYTPAVVIIELGGNDGLRGYPVKLMQKNLQRMIDLSQAKNAKVLLAGIEIPPNYGQRYTDAFRKGFYTLADKNDIGFIPFVLEGVATKAELMQDDGIHPTEEAQPMIRDIVWGLLQTLL